MSLTSGLEETQSTCFVVEGLVAAVGVSNQLMILHDDVLRKQGHLNWIPNGEKSRFNAIYELFRGNPEHLLRCRRLGGAGVYCKPINDCESCPPRKREKDTYLYWVWRSRKREENRSS
mmetsp:Transcript_44811/g.66490  ORF Transcript_44811/g.66490 Transcript_44811/m.66490 type:complete len:118 (-) Transcript_44811:53-406(-)